MILASSVGQLWELSRRAFGIHPCAGNSVAPLHTYHSPQMAAQGKQAGIPNLAPWSSSSRSSVGSKGYRPGFGAVAPVQRQPNRIAPQIAWPANFTQQNTGLPLCVICGQRPADQIRKSLFCTLGCVKAAETLAPAIINIPPNHPKYQDVENQFRSKWLHTNAPFRPVKRIYLIAQTAQSKATYNTYRLQVENMGCFRAQNRTAGNENRRFHGTRRDCLLGDPGKTRLCASQTCALCGIIRNSFDLGFYKSRTK